MNNTNIKCLVTFNGSHCRIRTKSANLFNSNDKTPFVVLRKVGFITDRYGCKSELLTTFGKLFPHKIENKVYETHCMIHYNNLLWSNINYVLLEIISPDLEFLDKS
jgi:hypothetical protein